MKQKPSQFILSGRYMFIADILLLTVLGIFLYSSHNVRGVTLRYAPLSDTVTQIMHETAVAHLLFEEITGSDKFFVVEKVLDHLDQAQGYVRVMLGKGEIPGEKIVPFHNTALQRELEQTIKSIDQFRVIAAERQEMQSLPGIGTKIDQQFDTVFQSILESAQKVKTSLRASMEAHFQRLSRLQYLLIFITALLATVFRTAVWYHERRQKKNMQGLKNQEEDLQTTLNSIGDAVIATDIQGNITRMNPVAEQLTGWTVKEIQGKPLTQYFNIVNARTGKPADNPVEKVFETGLTVGLANHTMLISKNGTQYQIADSAAPIRHMDGVTTGVILVFRDVSEEYRMREALRNSEQYQKTVFHVAPIGIGVVIDRVLKDVNHRLCEMTGYSEDEVLNKSARVFYPDDEEYDSVGREKYRQIDEHGAGTVETHWKHKNGRIIEVLLSSAPFDADDLSKGVAFTALDITTHKQAAKALQDSENRTRATFNAIIDAVFLHPLTEESFAAFTDVNDTACKRYGYLRDEFLTLTAADITKPTDANLHSARNHRQKLLDTGQLCFETIHIAKSGEEFPVEINSAVIHLDGCPFILAVVRDIGMRRRLAQENENLKEQSALTRKMESVGRLAGGVSHDLNNLITPILGFGELLLEDIPADAPYRDFVSQIIEAGKRARALVHQLLAFSRKQILAYERIEINKIVKGVEKLLRRAIPEDIEIEISTFSHLPPAMADKGQIEQVILNLAVNAADAMAGGGKLTINDSEITGNSSVRAGGGIEDNSGDATVVSLTNVRFNGNNAGNAPGNGGAVHITGSGNMDIDALRGFLAFVETSSFTRAAKQINRTQSAFSAQMRKLEEELNVTLFQKEGRNLVLTEAGLALRSHAEQLVALHNSALKQVKRYGDKQPLRLGCPEDYNDTILPKVIRLLQQAEPTCSIQVFSLPSITLREWLDDGRLDAAIVTRAPDSEEGYWLTHDVGVWISS